MDERKTIRKTDILIIGIFLAVAIFLYVISRIAGHTDAKHCVILRNGIAIEMPDLEKDGVFNIAQIPQMDFEIRNKKIAVIHSDCQDKVCLETGFIGEAGQKIVCLPNKIVVSINSEKQEIKNADEPDVVVQ